MGGRALGVVGGGAGCCWEWGGGTLGRFGGVVGLSDRWAAADPNPTFAAELGGNLCPARTDGLLGSTRLKSNVM